MAVGVHRRPPIGSRHGAVRLPRLDESDDGSCDRLSGHRAPASERRQRLDLIKQNRRRRNLDDELRGDWADHECKQKWDNLRRERARQREMERAGRTDCPAERCTPMSKRRSASSELYHHPSDDLLDSDADDPTEELCQPYTPRRPVDPCVPQRPAGRLRHEVRLPQLVELVEGSRRPGASPRGDEVAHYAAGLGTGWRGDDPNMSAGSNFNAGLHLDMPQPSPTERKTPRADMLQHSTLARSSPSSKNCAQTPHSLAAAHPSPRQRAGDAVPCSHSQGKPPAPPTGTPRAPPPLTPRAPPPEERSGAMVRRPIRNHRSCSPALTPSSGVTRGLQSLSAGPGPRHMAAANSPSAQLQALPANLGTTTQTDDAIENAAPLVHPEVVLQPHRLAFDAIDRNHDGVITREEFDAAIAQWQQVQSEGFHAAEAKAYATQTVASGSQAVYNVGSAAALDLSGLEEDDADEPLVVSTPRNVQLPAHVALPAMPEAPDVLRVPSEHGSYAMPTPGEARATAAAPLASVTSSEFSAPSGPHSPSVHVGPMLARESPVLRWVGDCPGVLESVARSDVDSTDRTDIQCDPPPPLAPATSAAPPTLPAPAELAAPAAPAALAAPAAPPAPVMPQAPQNLRAAVLAMSPRSLAAPSMPKAPPAMLSTSGAVEAPAPEEETLSLESAVPSIIDHTIPELTAVPAFHPMGLSGAGAPTAPIAPVAPLSPPPHQPEEQPVSFFPLSPAHPISPVAMSASISSLAPVGIAPLSTSEGILQQQHVTSVPPASPALSIALPLVLAQVEVPTTPCDPRFRVAAGIAAAGSVVSGTCLSPKSVSWEQPIEEADSMVEAEEKAAVDVALGMVGIPCAGNCAFASEKEPFQIAMAGVDNHDCSVADEDMALRFIGRAMATCMDSCNDADVISIAVDDARSTIACTDVASPAFCTKQHPQQPQQLHQPQQPQQLQQPQQQLQQLQQKQEQGQEEEQEGGHEREGELGQEQKPEQEQEQQPCSSVSEATMSSPSKNGAASTVHHDLARQVTGDLLFTAIQGNSVAAEQVEDNEFAADSCSCTFSAVQWAEVQSIQAPTESGVHETKAVALCANALSFAVYLPESNRSADQEPFKKITPDQQDGHFSFIADMDTPSGKVEENFVLRDAQVLGSQDCKVSVSPAVANLNHSITAVVMAPTIDSPSHRHVLPLHHDDSDVLGDALQAVCIPAVPLQPRRTAVQHYNDEQMGEEVGLACTCIMVAPLGDPFDDNYSACPPLELQVSLKSTSHEATLPGVSATFDTVGEPSNDNFSACPLLWEEESRNSSEALTPSLRDRTLPGHELGIDGNDVITEADQVAAVGSKHEDHRAISRGSTPVSHAPVQAADSAHPQVPAISALAEDLKVDGGTTAVQPLDLTLEFLEKDGAIPRPADYISTLRLLEAHITPEMTTPSANSESKLMTAEDCMESSTTDGQQTDGACDPEEEESRDDTTQTVAIDDLIQLRESDMKWHRWKTIGDRLEDRTVLGAETASQEESAMNLSEGWFRDHWNELRQPEVPRPLSRQRESEACDARPPPEQPLEELVSLRAFQEKLRALRGSALGANFKGSVDACSDVPCSPQPLSPQPSSDPPWPAPAPARPVIGGLDTPGVALLPPPPDFDPPLYTGVIGATPWCPGQPDIYSPSRVFISRHS